MTIRRTDAEKLNMMPLYKEIVSLSSGEPKLDCLGPIDAVSSEMDMLKLLGKTSTLVVTEFDTPSLWRKYVSRSTTFCW